MAVLYSYNLLHGLVTILTSVIPNTISLFIFSFPITFHFLCYFVGWYSLLNKSHFKYLALLKRDYRTFHLENHIVLEAVLCHQVYHHLHFLYVVQNHISCKAPIQHFIAFICRLLSAWSSQNSFFKFLCLLNIIKSSKLINIYRNFMSSTIFLRNYWSIESVWSLPSVKQLNRSPKDRWKLSSFYNHLPGVQGILTSKSQNWKSLIPWTI